MTRVAVLACVAACLPVALGSASTKPRWVATQLGTLSFPGTYGIDSDAVAVNARGEVLGESGFLRTAPPLRRAFVWERGRMTDLGTLGGAQSEPVDINAHGQIVGWSETDIPGQSHAFLWQNGKMTDLGASGGVLSTAIAINDRGQVIGSIASRDAEKSFLWRNGKTTLLPTAGPDFTGAMAINNRGEILGEALPPRGGAGPGHVLLWRNGKRLDLGYGTAGGINDRGDVVGITNGPLGLTYGRAILWQSGRRIVLGAEPSGRNNPNDSDVFGAVAINSQGDEIVGTLRRPDGHTRAVVWRWK